MNQAPFCNCYGLRALSNVQNLRAKPLLGTDTIGLSLVNPTQSRGLMATDPIFERI